MKDEKKQMLKNITVVLLLTACCILLFYQLNKQSAVWKKNVTLLSVNQKAVEEEWSGISNRPTEGAATRS